MNDMLPIDVQSPAWGERGIVLYCQAGGFDQYGKPIARPRRCKAKFDGPRDVARARGWNIEAMICPRHAKPGTRGPKGMPGR